MRDNKGWKRNKTKIKRLIGIWLSNIKKLSYR